MRKLLGPFLAVTLAVATLVVVGAGQALANHVQCGDVIAQDTTLDSDLMCSGDGLVIGAANVRLDLGGHTVTATGTRVRGIFNPGYDSVVVENGVVSVPADVRDTGTAIVLRAVAGNTLRDLSIRCPSGSVLAEGFVRGRIERSVMAGNVPVRVTGAEDSVIAQNRINGDLGYGIHVEGDGNQVTDNVVYSNSGLGAVGSRNLIARNQATDLHGTALTVSSGTHDVVEDNVLSAGTALWAHDLSDSRVSGNFGRTWYEFAFGLGSSNRVVIDHNVGEGLWLGASDDNRLVRNRLSHVWSITQFTGFFEGVPGVLIDPQSSGNTLLHNLAPDNSTNGIQVDNPNTRLVGNVADDNGNLGIEAVAGVAGAGNRASGNLNPAQCVPSYLCRPERRR